MIAIDLVRYPDTTPFERIQLPAIPQDGDILILEPEQEKPFRLIVRGTQYRANYDAVQLCVHVAVSTDYERFKTYTSRYVLS